MLWSLRLNFLEGHQDSGLAIPCGSKYANHIYLRRGLKHVKRTYFRLVDYGIWNTESLDIALILVPWTLRDRTTAAISQDVRATPKALRRALRPTYQTPKKAWHSSM